MPPRPADAALALAVVITLGVMIRPAKHGGYCKMDSYRRRSVSRPWLATARPTLPHERAPKAQRTR